MPEAEPVERVVHGREPGPDAHALLDLALELGQREVRGGQDQPLEQALERLEQRAPMPAVAVWRGTAGRLDPLHQLDRRRGRHTEAAGGFTDRTTTPDGLHDSLPEVQRERGRHGGISPDLNQYCRITRTDSTQ
jgi:hypothetical protein